LHHRSNSYCRSTPGVLAPVRVIVSRSIIAYSTPCAPLAGTARLRRIAAYTHCPRCVPKLQQLGDLRVVPGFRWPYCLDMSPSGTPGSSSVASIQLLHRRHWPSTICESLRRPQPPSPSDSRGASISGLNYGSLSLRPVDLLALLSEQTGLSPSPPGLLLPGFRRIGHPYRRRV
jgi:hypothetical protein